MKYLFIYPKKSKAFYHRGSENVQYVVSSEGKTMYTVLFCGNAAGEYLPPYVIYKGSTSNMFDTWMNGGPPNTSYNLTKSGWMEYFVFEAWFKSVLLPSVSEKPKPKVVLFDGHWSQLTHATAIQGKEKDVAIVCLPPHTSSALQPFDVGVYGPAKKVWYSILHQFYRESRQKTVTKPAFPALLNLLYSRAFIRKPSNLEAGFRKASLCPWNKDAIPQAKLVLCRTTESGDTREDAHSSSDASVEPSFEIISTPSQNAKPPMDSSTPKTPSNMTPRKAMRAAKLQAIQPVQTDAAASALNNAAKRRKRVQRNHGEVLTYK